MKLVTDDGPFVWPIAFALETGDPYLVSLFWREGPQLDKRGPAHLLHPVKTLPEVTYRIARDAGLLPEQDDEDENSA